MRKIFGESVYGIEIDPQTRCSHYKSVLDIIAIKFKCCGKWYPCIECHRAIAGHETEVWPLDQFAELAILCGGCGHQLSVGEYMSSNSACPKCRSEFNPGCANHYHLYFQMAGRQD